MPQKDDNQYDLEHDLTTVRMTSNVVLIFLMLSIPSFLSSFLPFPFLRPFLLFDFPDVVAALVAAVVFPCDSRQFVGVRKRFVAANAFFSLPHAFLPLQEK